MTAIPQLLQRIFNRDFTGLSPAACREAFFARHLTLADLSLVCETLQSASATAGNASLPAAIRIPGRDGSGPPFVILAQLHGNEPAGLAGILLAMALSRSGHLACDVIGALGNALAAGQYFTDYKVHPEASQETRDAFRCGLSDSGALLPDLNRIPTDFRTRDATDYHTRRARELYALGTQAGGILDIHTARGSMLCITDHKRDVDLARSPIRSVLTGLAEAIAAHASATVTVRTLKTLLAPLGNLTCHVGIEAGRHEAPDSPHHAASFTLSLLYTLGLTEAEPLTPPENGQFDGYAVQPRIAYADLPHDEVQPGDAVYMARACHSLASVPARSDTVAVRTPDGSYTLQSVADFTHSPAGGMEYAVYQYDEMEAVEAGQVVAVALPSGAVFRAGDNFSGIFFSKSALLYDKDPSVGPWPVAADRIAEVKFCYPCKVENIALPCCIEQRNGP